MGKQFSAIHFRGQNVPNVSTSETLSLSAKFPPHLCLFLALHLVSTSALCSLNANLHSFSVSSVTSNGRTDIPEEHRQEAHQRWKNRHAGMWQWVLSTGLFFFLSFAELKHVVQAIKKTQCCVRHSGPLSSKSTPLVSPPVVKERKINAKNWITCNFCLPLLSCHVV